MTFRTPAGRPASMHHGGEQLGGQRGQVRGLEHHGAAGGDGRGDLAGGHGQREVPRRDQQARAHRLLGHQQPGLAVRGDRVAAERADGLLGEPAQELGAVGDLAAGLGQRLAHLQGHQQREVLGPLGDQLEGPAQDLAAFPGRDLRPGLLRGGGRVQGRLAVLGAGVGDAQQHLPGGGILDVEGLPGRGRTPLAVDQQAGRNRRQQGALPLRGNNRLGSYSHDDSLVSNSVGLVCWHKFLNEFSVQALVPAGRHGRLDYCHGTAALTGKSMHARTTASQTMLCSCTSGRSAARELVPERQRAARTAA